LDISLRTKYGKGIQEFVVVSTMKQKEKLIDFILMYPPPLNKDMIKSKYQDILEASQNQMKEQYMRFSAPLQHRKTDEKTMNDTFLPAIKGAKKQEEKKPLVMPGPQQIAAAHRLMMGHSSTKTSIQPPTPPQQIKEPLQKKSSINYGLVYREKIEGLKNKPTIAMSQITFGSFG
jgi:chromosomal replication initiation ATPase DnaA